MKNRQSGMSLLEILAAIAVGTVLFIGLTGMIDVSLEDAKGQQAAHHQAQLVNAAQKYIAEEYATLMDQTSTGAVKAVNVDNKLKPFLPDGFEPLNTYRQNTCVLVRQKDGKLNALVVTYGGIPIPDRSIAAVAMNAGQGAGFISSTLPGKARGPSWSLDTDLYRNVACDGGIPLQGLPSDAGHLVSNIFYDGPGNIRTDFLYRNEVNGRSDLNRMDVPLQMGNAGLVNLNDPCTHTALALERTTKDVVVCDGSAWRYSASSWKAPVANWGALTSTPGNNGDVRVTLDTGRAFVRNGGSWAALAVDQNGDLFVPEDLAVGANMTAEGQLHTGDHIYTATDIHVGKNLFVRYGRLDVRNVNVSETLVAKGDIEARENIALTGNLVAKGSIDADVYVHSPEVRAKWMATDTIVLDGISTAGYGSTCNYMGSKSDGKPVIINPIGTMLRDPNGILLNCISGPYGGAYFAYANGKVTP